MFSRITLSLAVLIHSIGTVHAAPQEKLSEFEQIKSISNPAERLTALEAYARKVLFIDIKHGQEVAHEVKNLAKKLRNKKSLMNGYNWMGLMTYYRSEPDTAFMYFDSLVKLAKREKDTLMLAKAHGNRGMVFENKSNYSRAFKEYSFALEQADKLRDSSLMASSLGNMGNVSIRLEQPKEALVYLRRALEIFKRLGNKRAEANQYNSMSQAYDIIHDTVNIKKYLGMAAGLYREIGDKRSLATVLTNLATVEFEKGQTDEAFRLAVEALTIKRGFNDLSGSSVLLINLSIYYNKKKMYKESMQVLNEALALSIKEGNIYDRSQAMLKMAAVYRFTGRTEKAYDMILDYLDVKDSLLGETTRRAVAEYEQKYEAEKKQYEIDKLNKNKELNELKLRESHLTIEQQTTNRNILLGVLGFAAVVLLLVIYGFVQKRKSNRELALRNQEIQNQKELLEEKNKEIVDSINYAKRLQDAILPPKRLVKQYLEDSFILYKPKDIVAGDFYWMESVDGTVYFAAADCTGHGVPGAMVSVVCSNALNRAVKEFGIKDPGKILDKVRELVIETFAKSESEVKDGMDISLCSMSFQVPGSKFQDGNHMELGTIKPGTAATLQWAGANNPLWILRKDAQEIEEIKPDKQPIGIFSGATAFTTHQLTVHPGDSLYLFTDGYADQFGGEKGKKFKVSNMKALILQARNQSMDEQYRTIYNSFELWRGNLEQVDDVCMIGVRM